jgi:hypothetical protein
MRVRLLKFNYKKAEQKVLGTIELEPDRLMRLHDRLDFGENHVSAPYQFYRSITYQCDDPVKKAFQHISQLIVLIKLKMGEDDDILELIKEHGFHPICNAEVIEISATEMVAFLESIAWRVMLGRKKGGLR